MKKCSRCMQTKDEKEFHLSKGAKDGLYSSCKKCKNAATQSMRRSYNGKIKALYQGMVDRCKNKMSYKNRAVEFSIAEFKQYIKRHNFKKIYNEWVESGYAMSLSPSVDRINNKKGYLINNIQIVTLGDNVKKDRRGENINTAVLKEADVLVAREAYRSKTKTIAQLAREYGVQRAGMGKAIHGKTWKHI